MQPTVRFYPLHAAAEERLAYAVIAARHRGISVFCRHRDRLTWECPGGHIEPGETSLQAARRELYEETSTADAEVTPVCVYSVAFPHQPETFGLLCRAELAALGALPAGSEMACVQTFDSAPESWTYPHIQPLLVKRAWKDADGTPNAAE